MAAVSSVQNANPLAQAQQAKLHQAALEEQKANQAAVVPQAQPNQGGQQPQGNAAVGKNINITA